MIQRSKLGLNFFARRFRRHVYLRDLSIVVMRDILQSRYLRRRVAHKQLARTSLNGLRKAGKFCFCFFFFVFFLFLFFCYESPLAINYGEAGKQQ